LDDAGLYNTLGNHRFIRFNVAGTRTVNISASSANPATPDTDFVVYHDGAVVALGIDGINENPEVESFTATAGTYIIDVYDCANGCDTVQGTAGDYNLTVTIN